MSGDGPKGRRNRPRDTFRALQFRNRKTTEDHLSDNIISYADCSEAIGYDIQIELDGSLKYAQVTYGFRSPTHAARLRSLIGTTSVKMNQSGKTWVYTFYPPKKPTVEIQQVELSTNSAIQQQVRRRTEKALKNKAAYEQRLYKNLEKNVENKESKTPSCESSSTDITQQDPPPPMEEGRQIGRPVVSYNAVPCPLNVVRNNRYRGVKISTLLVKAALKVKHCPVHNVQRKFSRYAESTSSDDEISEASRLLCDSGADLSDIDDFIQYGLEVLNLQPQDLENMTISSFGIPTSNFHPYCLSLKKKDKPSDPLLSVDDAR